MTGREKRDIIIYDILQPSLCRLYEMDYFNICIGVSERNICARLAHYMENIMRKFDRDHNSGLFIHYYADVEYNRMGLESQRYENSEHLTQYMVADLLIQSRGEPRNLLAVEMKRSTNYENRKEDRERLEALVSPVPVHNELYAQNELLSNFNRRFIAQASLIVRNASIYRALREVSACKLSYRSNSNYNQCQGTKNNSNMFSIIA